jgi:hypothetical protein
MNIADMPEQLIRALALFYSWALAFLDLDVNCTLAKLKS